MLDINSRADDFIWDVRRAVRLEQKPTVTTDSQIVDVNTAEQALQRAALWLTPKIVEGYTSAAFSSWNLGLQEELRRAVEDFRKVAATVPPDKGATATQFHDGLRAFAQLKLAVRKVVLMEWEPAAKSLINDVEKWAQEFGWATRRESKMMNEMLIGDYQLDQLYFHAEKYLYVLDPLARFIPGGLGAFDLSIQPSFYVTSIYRHLDTHWFVHLDVGQGLDSANKSPLTKGAFRQAVTELRSLL